MRWRSVIFFLLCAIALGLIGLICNNENMYIHQKLFREHSPFSDVRAVVCTWPEFARDKMGD